MKLLQSTLLAAVSSMALFGTQSCAAPETQLQPLVASTRMDPPEQGKNKVWVEYQDQTAQGGGFEDAIWEGLQEAIQERGYVPVTLPAEADYVLWATTRLIDRVEGEESYNKALAGLGAIAGGVGGAFIGNSVGGRTGTWVGAAGGGFLMKLATEKLTQVNVFLCVTDLQIGSRRAEAMTVEEQTETIVGADSRSGVGASSPGGLASVEASEASASNSSRSSFVRETFFAEKEQRLVLTAKGTRMNLGQAKELMIPKLIDGVVGQIVKYRGV